MSSNPASERTAFCFDMDGIVTEVGLVSCIASELGIADEVTTLSNAIMNGHNEFEASFRLLCLLLERIDPQVIRKVVATMPLNENLLWFIRDHKESCFIVTENLDIWIQPILDRCGCRVISSKGIYLNGRLKIESILNKAQAIRAIREESYERVVVVGHWSNDAVMLAQADVGIAFGEAAKASIHASRYVIHDGSALCSLLRML